MRKTLPYKPREEASERIEGYIIAEGLGPNDKLPSERELCELWDMNRTTLRSAIKTLLAEGKLYNKVGSGTFVAPPKLTRNLQDMLPFSTLVAQADRRLSTRLLSKRIMECNKKVSLRLDVPLGRRIFELVRLRSVDGKPVLIETCFLDALRFPAIDGFDYEANSLYGILERSYGTVVSRGQEQLCLTYASGEEAKLLEVPDGEPLFHLTGTAGADDGPPVEFFDSVLRTDRIRFASVLRQAGS